MRSRPPTIAELYLAFRQAKITLFFERRGVGLLDLAQFEESLPENLKRLWSKLEANWNWFDGVNLGQVYIVPKRQRIDSSEENQVVIIGGRRSQAQPRELDVQLRLNPTLEFVIIEVLYLLKFGAVLDSLLRDEVVGYRLDTRGEVLSPTRRWLFQFWPERYNEFRSAPLAAARKELERTRSGSVIILSTDLASFYDTVNAGFLLQDSFLSALESRATPGFDFEDFHAATSSLLHSFAQFRKEAGSLTGLSLSTGIPIGALTSRLRPFHP